MTNVRSTLLAIVVAFALVGAASSAAYADDPVEGVPSALPDTATPSAPAVFTDEDPADEPDADDAQSTPVSTDSGPVAVLGLALPGGGSANMEFLDPGDPGLPPD